MPILYNTPACRLVGVSKRLAACLWRYGITAVSLSYLSGVSCCLRDTSAVSFPYPHVYLNYTCPPPPPPPRCGRLRSPPSAPQGSQLRSGRALTLPRGSAPTSGQLLPPLHRSPTPLRSALCGSLHSRPYIPLLLHSLKNRKSLPRLTLAASDILTSDAIRLLTNCAAVCLRSGSAPPPLRYCSAPEFFVPWLHLNFKVLSS